MYKFFKNKFINYVNLKNLTSNKILIFFYKKFKIRAITNKIAHLKPWSKKQKNQIF
jgi:hypothetical protein